MKELPELVACSSCPTRRWSLILTTEACEVGLLSSVGIVHIGYGKPQVRAAQLGWTPWSGVLTDGLSPA